MIVDGVEIEDTVANKVLRTMDSVDLKLRSAYELSVQFPNSCDNVVVLTEDEAVLVYRLLSNI